MMDEKNKVIVVAKYKQCNDFALSERLRFHGKMKPVKSIAFGYDRLWIGLQVPDDYYNTSVFSYRLD